jgi:hypothetical protein
MSLTTWMHEIYRKTICNSKTQNNLKKFNPRTLEAFAEDEKRFASLQLNSV